MFFFWAHFIKLNQAIFKIGTVYFKRNLLIQIDYGTENHLLDTFFTSYFF